MRASLIKRISSELTAKAVVMVVLASDAEVAYNVADSKVSIGRSLKSLQEYDTRITRDTLFRLVKDGLVERVGFNYRIKF